MYVIVVYDIAQERVNRVCKYLRRFLNWVQNSAFEGELNLAQLEEVKLGVRELIDPAEDSIYFYLLRDMKWLNKEVIGIEKNPIERVL